MDMLEKCDVIREYDVNDPAIQNIMQEIDPENENGVHQFMNRVSDLLESFENRRINLLLNFLLYGMILNDAQSMDVLQSIHGDIEEFMKSYHTSLDAVEDAIAADRSMELTTLPELVNALRMDKDFYKNHKKDLNALLKFLPEIKSNLELISRVLLGM